MFSNKTTEPSTNNINNRDTSFNKDPDSINKNTHNSDLLQIAKKIAINSTNILKSSLNSPFKASFNPNPNNNNVNNSTNNNESTFLASLANKTASFLNKQSYPTNNRTNQSPFSISQIITNRTSPAATPSTSIVFQAAPFKSIDLIETNNCQEETDNKNNPSKVSYLGTTNQLQKQQLFQKSSTSNSSFNNFKYHSKNELLIALNDDTTSLVDKTENNLTVCHTYFTPKEVNQESLKQMNCKQLKSIDTFKMRSNSINISQSTNQTNNNNTSLNRCLLKNLTRETNQLSYVTESEGFIQLNQYKLKNEIGKGSYGIVKLAYNDQDNRNYAMKMISKKKLIKKSSLLRRAPSRQNSSVSYNCNNQNYMLERVYKEIAILKKLDHQNVVKLIEVLDDPNEDYLCLAFEYFEKGTLIDIPTEYPLPEHVAWRYFRELTLGIEYLHYQKIIHRDIKPSNLLLGNDNHIKIADFGVSNEFDGDDAVISNSLGTPAFTPPEAITEHSLSWFGKPLDIWSLGITLYAFVYGQCPFQDDNIIALRNMILHTNVQFPDTPKVSGILKDLILKLLTKDPVKRIKMENIKKHKWITTHPIKNEYCPLVTNNEIKPITVTEDEVKNSVVSLSKLDTLIFIKSMIKKRSFGNPYRMNISSISNPNSLDMAN